ncbi:MAG: cytochrome b/b6 domain-containing protein [Desulfosudaceae bacterium]
MIKDNKIYLYTRFERFWHWAQTLLILILIATGLEIHGLYEWLGFEMAVEVHNISAWTWLGLYVFILFWMATTGEWKQYVPTFRKLLDVVFYYLIGIFKGAPHPVPKTARTKHNPLQRLAYLAIVMVLVPFQIITGFLYYYYNDWPAMGWDWGLAPMALLHTAGGFAIMSFIIVHVYMTTTGPTPTAHIKPMITGWDEVEEAAGHEWEEKTPAAS